MKFIAAVCTFLGFLAAFSGKTIAGETGHYVSGVEGIRSGTVPPPGLYYLNQEKTWSAAILARYETHSSKDHTDIRPGDNFHFEWGIGKAIDKTLEAGLAGYSQWQVTDDSGSDVTWSKSVHDQVHAIGPEVNLAIPSESMFLTFRYLWEFHTVDSPEGQLMALTLTKRF